MRLPLCNCLSILHHRDICAVHLLLRDGPGSLNTTCPLSSRDTELVELPEPCFQNLNGTIGRAVKGRTLNGEGWCEEAAVMYEIVKELQEIELRKEKNEEEEKKQNSI
jgi:hypothetical protein